MNLDHPAERIEWIIKEYYEGFASRFAKAMDVTPSALIPIKSGNNYPGWKIVAGIMAAHPEINPDWLVLGKGTRLREIESDVFKLQHKNIQLRKKIDDIVKFMEDN